MVANCQSQGILLACPDQSCPLHESVCLQVVWAAEWLSLGREPPINGSLGLPEAIPKDLCLQHLKLCCQLIKGKKIQPDSFER